MKVLIVLRNIFRGIFRFLDFLLVPLFVQLIRLVTYEPGKKNVLTTRKARRIRFFTNCKIFLYKHFKWLIRFLGKEEYYKLVYKKFSYGV